MKKKVLATDAKPTEWGGQKDREWTRPEQTGRM